MCRNAMFGGTDEEEEEEEESSDEETWEEMKSRVEEATEAIEKEREPFRFELFRDEDGNIIQWTLMADGEVNGKTARVPLVHGGDHAVWFDYPNRYAQERDAPSLFEWGEREELIPSNIFYAWISDAVTNLAEYNSELQKVDQDAFRNLQPEFPPFYDELAEYERETLEFFRSIVLEHRDYTPYQKRLVFEAVRRYPVDDEVWEEFAGFDQSEDEE